MFYNTLLFTLQEDIAIITVNRADKLNALNAEVLNELHRAFTFAKSNETVKGIILTGAGEKSFVAGADIQQEFPTLDVRKGHRFAMRGQTVFSRIEELAKPVVAAVNGYALGGGCELAMACHVRLASENAVFGQPEVGLGLIPGFGGTQRLPRIVGRGIATELILTGERISAQRAYEIGLVNKVVPAGELMDASKEMLKKIIANAPLAIGMALEALQDSDLPLREGLRQEAALFGQTCGTEDFKEGISAFLERRKPSFKGK